MLGAGVTARSTRLADGRELIYYDDPGSDRAAERAVDTRTLDPRPATAAMRRDVLTGDWISVAAARQHRAFLPPAELDPLAPQTASNPSEIPADYDVAVFENRSPAFGPGTGAEDAAPDGPGLGRVRPAIGRCEVVCFSPAHEGSFGTQTAARARTVIEAWADRTRALSALPGVEQVFPFENRGEEIGVTLSHPHGQIYAYPFVTPHTARMLDSARRYHDRTGANLFADVLAEERAAGERIVAETEHWTAFVPAAARWPVEVHLYPSRRVTSIPELDDTERDEFARLYLDVLGRFDALYDQPLPYIAAWHQAPVRTGHDLAYLHLRLFSIKRAPNKLKYLAGSESAMGAFVTDVLPEDVAARLRDLARPATEVTS